MIHVTCKNYPRCKKRCCQPTTWATISKGKRQEFCSEKCKKEWEENQIPSDLSEQERKRLAEENKQEDKK